jgi:Ca-activated chloride channel homolog
MPTRLSILWFLLAPAAVGAQGWIIPRPCVRPLGDRVNPGVLACPTTSIVRTRSDVRARMDAARAVHYEVEERFVNRGSVVGEADYMFPLPKGAAFSDLKLSINGDLVSGETMNANDARRIYEEIVRRQRDPALVEWMGHGLLRARIFPINPGEEKRVVVRFDAVAEREGDALRVDYFRGGAPNGAGIAVARENDGDRSRDGERSTFTISYEQSSAFGLPYSPTHSLEMSDDGRMRRIDVRGDARDLTLLFPLRRPGAPAISALTYATGGEDGFALITLTPPAGSAREVTPRDVTFVLDVSGSMSGRKIEQAKAAGRQLLSTLNEQDRFRLIDFSTDVRTFRDDFVYATRENVRDATRYLDALDAQGSTNISGALAEALRTPRRAWDRDRDDRDYNGPRVRDARRLPLVLFVTDGEPTVGERNPEAIAQLAARDRGDARVFTFGLGSDVNVTLLERLALEGRGTAQFVRPDESVERMVSVVASRLVDPVVTDVRVHTDGDVRLSKILPQQPIDLFAGQDLVLLGRYSGHGDAHIIFEGRRGDETVRWTSTVDFPDRERENPFVARLWATQRVGYLAAEKRRNVGGDTREIDDEIRSLGERFGIPTEFTSYLVQEPRTLAVNGVRRLPVMGGVAGGTAAPSAAPAPSRADKSFAEAKAASAQRATTSIAALDSMSSVTVTGAQTRRVDARTFELRGDTWTDVRYRTGTRTLHVQPYSRAYFELIDKLPDLRAVFALGDRVVVMGRAAAIELDAKASEPSRADIEWAMGNW